jgi:hypothetical protein
MCNTGNKLLENITKENFVHEMALLKNTKCYGEISWKKAAQMG